MKRLILALILAVSTTFSGDFVSGVTTCPTSGVKQLSATPYYTYQLTAQAKYANLGTISVGGNTVTTTSGAILVPGASYNASKPSAAVSPNTLYFACTNNTDGITWIASR